MDFRELNIDEGIRRECTTTLPFDVVKYVKEKGYKYNDLIRLGIIAKEGNPQLLERIRTLEAIMPRIESKLDKLLNYLKIDTALEIEKMVKRNPYEDD